MFMRLWAAAVSRDLLDHCVRLSFLNNDFEQRGVEVLASEVLDFRFLGASWEPYWFFLGLFWALIWPSGNARAVSLVPLGRPRADPNNVFGVPKASKRLQERPIRSWKPPLGRPSLFKGSKRPPRALQEASRAH